MSATSREAGASTTDLVEWLRATVPGESRQLVTAVQALDSARLPHELATVEWFDSNLDVLAARLDSTGRVSAASVASYRSRAKRALTYFRNHGPATIAAAASAIAGLVANRPQAEERRGRAQHWAMTTESVWARHVSCRPLPPAEQIASALRAIADWPDLYPFLLPALADAQRALTGTPEPSAGDHVRCAAVFPQRIGKEDDR